MRRHDTLFNADLALRLSPLGHRGGLGVARGLGVGSRALRVRGARGLWLGWGGVGGLGGFGGLGLGRGLGCLCVASEKLEHAELEKEGSHAARL